MFVSVSTIRKKSPKTPSGIGALKIAVYEPSTSRGSVRGNTPNSRSSASPKSAFGEITTRSNQSPAPVA